MIRLVYKRKLVAEQHVLIADRDDVVVENSGIDRGGVLLQEEGVFWVQLMQASDRLAGEFGLTSREGFGRVRV